ncbi:hypothetical protein CW304_24150 [Bacillus sp. UFRGS-B20]|nr:hypothetical protein CW304_24150 [Bacillus sp. UFRGS-B20]
MFQIIKENNFTYSKFRISSAVFEGIPPKIHFLMKSLIIKLYLPCLRNNKKPAQPFRLRFSNYYSSFRLKPYFPSFTRHIQHLGSRCSALVRDEEIYSPSIIHL